MREPALDEYVLTVGIGGEVVILGTFKKVWSSVESTASLQISGLVPKGGVLGSSLPLTGTTSTTLAGSSPPLELVDVRLLLVFSGKATLGFSSLTCNSNIL